MAKQKPEKYDKVAQVLFKPSELEAIRRAAADDPSASSVGGWIRTQCLKALKRLGPEYYR